MPRDIIQQLKELKNSPEAGALRVSEKGAGRDALMLAIGHQDATPRSFGLRDVLLFYRWNVSQFVSMPATMTAALLVLVLGGWMTTVTAASSLPGDALYGLKLVTEQAQLSLASLESKAVLHTEFAERRLKEAVALEATMDPEKQTHVTTALDAFAKELSLAEGSLRQMKTEGNLDTIHVATTVDQKIGALTSVIDSGQTSEAGPTSDEVRTITREASNGVVDVMVETHEASLDPLASKQDMHALFKVKLQDLRHRETFDLGRVVVIENVSALHGFDISMVNAKNEIEGAMSVVSEAETLAAAGGYRAAFDLLRDAEIGLMAAEAMIAEAEIWIIEQLATPEAPAAEGTESIESTSDSPVSESTS